MATTGTSSPMRFGQAVATPLAATAIADNYGSEGRGASSRVALTREQNDAIALSEAVDAGQVDQQTDAERDAADSQALREMSGDSTDAQEAAATPVVDPSAKLEPSVNKLHDYATYTYGLTMFILGESEFADLQAADASSMSSWNPKLALISSAGRYNDSFNMIEPERTIRHPSFKEDFYFDSFRLNTVVGMSSRSRGTNAIEISFTIIEPYGMTLLERLIDAAASVQSKNYLDQPYLLELDFFGSADSGENVGKMFTPIPDLRKRLPIKLIGMKIKASAKGTEYSITAIPFNHSAFKENNVTVPVNLEVAASTVENFFKSTGTSSKLMEEKTLRDETQKKAEAESRANRDANDARAGNISPGRDIKIPYNVENLTDAINDWHKSLVNDKYVTYADSVEFNIDPEIAASSITVPAKRAPSSAAMPKDQNHVSDSKDVRTFAINAGTNIVEIINNVLRNSDYITKQLVNFKESNKPAFDDDVTVKFYKIIPQIARIQFDPKRNVYATHTVFHVVKFEYFNSKHPNLPYANPKGPVKAYNYLYTGLNTDILNFDIDFDTAFYTTIQAATANTSKGNPAPDADVNSDGTTKEVRPLNSTPDSVSPHQIGVVAELKNVTASGANSVSTSIAAAAVDSIYSGSRGDMISVKLKIVGDPDFIKQDDVYTNPGMKNYKNKGVTVNGVNGSVKMDHSDIFCRITFRTPSDMDEFTGLPVTDGKFTTSKFSGLYRILTVESDFSKGQFSQNLTCVRIFDFAGNSKKATGRDIAKASDSAVIDSDARLPNSEETALLNKYPAPVVINNSDGSDSRFARAEVITTPQITNARQIDAMYDELEVAKQDAAKLRESINPRTRN